MTPEQIDRAIELYQALKEGKRVNILVGTMTKLWEQWDGRNYSPHFKYRIVEPKAECWAVFAGERLVNSYADLQDAQIDYGGHKGGPRYRIVHMVEADEQ